MKKIISKAGKVAATLALTATVVVLADGGGSGSSSCTVCAYDMNAWNPLLPPNVVHWTCCPNMPNYGCTVKSCGIAYTDNYGNVICTCHFSCPG